MPNPGGPSLGCQTCKSRKIKCDRTEPECRRCVKRGLPCPGYPKLSDATFKHETFGTMSRRSTSAAQLPASTVSPYTSIAVSSQAVLADYFMEQVAMDVGWYGHLPVLLNRLPQSSCARLAVAAAGGFLAANRSTDRRVFMDAVGFYAKTTRSLNHLLGGPNICVGDEVLISTLLLNILDDIAGHNSFMTGSHLNGCLTLLLMQSGNGTTTTHTPNIAHSVVIQTQGNLLSAYQAPLEGPRVWLSQQTTQAPARLVSTMCLQTGKLKHQVKQLQRSTTEGSSTRRAQWAQVHREAQKLDAAFNDWYVCGGSRWQRRFSNVKDGTGTVVTTDFYADVQVSKVWNHYRCARVALLSIISDAAEKWQESSDPSLESTGSLLLAEKDLIAASIKEMLGDIVNSIPFHLQLIDEEGRPCSPLSRQVLGSCAILWPLEQVLRCAWALEEQKRRATECLEYIAYSVGIRQALVVLSDLDRQSGFDCKW